MPVMGGVGGPNGDITGSLYAARNGCPLDRCAGYGAPVSRADRCDADGGCGGEACAKSGASPCRRDTGRRAAAPGVGSGRCGGGLTAARQSG